MGKYMKKGKITEDVAVMEVSQSALGVRTRAKTLALQQTPEVCYLQLRSRRLEKPRFPAPSPPRKLEKQEKSSKQSNRSPSSCSSLRVESVNSGLSGSASKKGEAELEKQEEQGCYRNFRSGSTAKKEVDELGVEASFGENNLEFDGIGRSTRESTPCSLMRDLGSIGTPGSAMRSTCSGAVNQRRVQDPVERNIPSTHEMEDFFATVERQQQKRFMDRYNFDVLNDVPLSGRYEWVRVDP